MAQLVGVLPFCRLGSPFGVIMGSNCISKLVLGICVHVSGFFFCHVSQSQFCPVMDRQPVQGIPLYSV